jgi:hypothetical protein
VSATLLNHLSASERELVAQTEPAALATLDEDAAIELHDRVRRARNKAISQYRRGGARKVAEKGARGKAHGATRGAAAKVEVLEHALYRTSRRVAVLSKQSADALRAERIAAARGEKAAAPVAKQAAPKPATHAAKKTPASRTVAATKRHADTRSTGARRQAKRDAR